MWKPWRNPQIWAWSQAQQGHAGLICVSSNLFPSLSPPWTDLQQPDLSTLFIYSWRLFYLRIFTMVGALARSLSRVQMAFLAAQQALCLGPPREEENVIIRSKPGEEPWIMTVAINLSADMLLWLKSATPSERARQRCVLRRSSCSSVCRAVFSQDCVHALQCRRCLLVPRPSSVRRPMGGVR